MFALSAVLLARTSAGAADPGVLGHSWSATLSTYAAGSKADLLVTQALAQPGGIVSPPGAPLVNASLVATSGITPSAAAQPGDDVGALALGAQTNLDPALAQTYNIDPQTGQPPRCGAPGTLAMTPPAAELYAAVLPGGSVPTVQTTPDADPSKQPYAVDQEADLPNHGPPKAVNATPDWLPTLVGSLGMTGNLLARSYGVMKLAPGAPLSVNVLTFGITATSDVVVAILGTPWTLANPALQALEACAPASSSLILYGGGHGASWSCVDYFGVAVPGCTGSTQVVAGAPLLTLAAGGSYDVQAALRATPNADADADPASGTPVFTGLDNCPLDRNAGQADAGNLRNGIGDACRSGGSWANSSASAVTNAGIGCTVAGNSYVDVSPDPAFNDGAGGGHRTLRNGADFSGALPSPLAQQTIPGQAAGWGWLNCQDADNDGVLNAVDNCPLAANSALNGAAGDSQRDGDGDGVGDACSPAALQPRPGATPYANGPLGFATAGTQVGGYYDLCDQPSTAAGPTGAPTCTPINRSGDGVADFATVRLPTQQGTQVVCVQDHAADSIGDGYSDADRALPAGTPSCPPNNVPTGFFGPFPGGGGAATTPVGCFTQPLLARSDVDLDNQVTIVDINLISGAFLTSWKNPADPTAELDIDGDGQITIVDLSIAQTYYLVAVDAGCGKAPVSGSTQCPSGVIVYQAATGGCITATRTAGGGGAPDQYAVTWDRLPGGPSHTIGLNCTGAPPEALSFTVTTASGRFAFPAQHSTGCTVVFDTTHPAGSFP
jgi:hypothetical protein